jgi:hypothetical protein
VSAASEDCRKAALAAWGDTGWARVTALAKGDYLGVAGRTTSTDSGVEELIVIEPTTTDDAAWAALTLGIQAWRPPPGEATPRARRNRAHG